MSNPYKGSITLISGITPANDGSFPLVNAKDVQVDDNGKRLDVALQELLSSTETGGQITVDDALSDSSINPVRNSVIKAALDAKANSNHTHDVATTSANGLMSSTDKTNLNNLQTKFGSMSIDTALNSTSVNPVQNKVVNTALGSKLNKSGHTANMNLVTDSSGNITTVAITPNITVEDVVDIEGDPVQDYQAKLDELAGKLAQLESKVNTLESEAIIATDI